MSTLLPPGRPATGLVPDAPRPGAVRARRVGTRARPVRSGAPVPDRLRADPRSRLLGVVVGAALDGQLGRIPIAELCHEAGVPERRDFYRWFASKQDAFLHACLEIDGEFRGRMAAAYAAAAELPPRDRAEACLQTLVTFVEEDPRRAEAWIVRGHVAGSDFAIAREQTIRWLVDLGLQVTEEAPGASSSRALAVEMALGGVHEIVLSRLAGGRGHELSADLELMIDLLMRPFGERTGPRAQAWPSADPRDPREPPQDERAA